MLSDWNPVAFMVRLIKVTMKWMSLVMFLRIHWFCSVTFTRSKVGVTYCSLNNFKTKCIPSTHQLGVLDSLRLHNFKIFLSCAQDPLGGLQRSQTPSWPLVLHRYSLNSHFNCWRTLPIAPVHIQRTENVDSTLGSGCPRKDDIRMCLIFGKVSGLSGYTSWGEGDVCCWYNILTACGCVHLQKIPITVSIRVLTTGRHPLVRQLISPTSH